MSNQQPARLYYSKELDCWVRQPTANDQTGIAVTLVWSETMGRYVTVPQ